MNVNSAPAVSSAPLINLLKASQQSQVEMVEKLITTGLEMQVQAQDMELAAQIIDVYA